MNLAKLINEEVPSITPPGWYPSPAGPGAICTRLPISGMAVIYSISTTEDGRRWHHVSLSFPDRIPGWQEMVHVVQMLPWFDQDREIFMTLPKKTDYVNICKFAMHWWQEIKAG